MTGWYFGASRRLPKGAVVHADIWNALKHAAGASAHCVLRGRSSWCVDAAPVALAWARQAALDVQHQWACPGEVQDFLRRGWPVVGDEKWSRITFPMGPGWEAYTAAGLACEAGDVAAGGRVNEMVDHKPRSRRHTIVYLCWQAAGFVSEMTGDALLYGARLEAALQQAALTQLIAAAPTAQV